MTQQRSYRPFKRLGVWGVCLSLFSLSLSGCASSPYERAQQAATREDRSYATLETRAFATATLKSEAFRRAYVAKYSKLFALTPIQQEQLLAAELDEHKDWHVVIVAFYTPKLEWNELDPNRGIWSVKLRSPTGEIGPKAINRLDYKDPTWRKLYPYQDNFHTLYELRFPRHLSDGSPLAQPGEALKLIIAGAPAQLSLEWKQP